MNSIVERLRSIGNNTRRDAAREAATLIEQQAERIKELEAWRDSWVKCPEGAAAQRIKELEAETLAANQAMLKAVNEMLALRQRIDDAPVVAWMSPGKERLEFSLPSTVYGSHTIPLISKEDLK